MKLQTAAITHSPATPLRATLPPSSIASWRLVAHSLSNDARSFSVCQYAFPHGNV